MPLTAKHATQKERILNSATQLFARQGYHGTSTREIARLADVSENTIFRQFDRKEALFWAVLHSRCAAVKLRRDLLEGMAEGEAPEVILPRIIEFLSDILNYSPELLRLIAVALLEMQMEGRHLLQRVPVAVDLGDQRVHGKECAEPPDPKPGPDDGDRGADGDGAGAPMALASRRDRKDDLCRESGRGARLRGVLAGCAGAPRGGAQKVHRSDNSELKNGLSDMINKLTFLLFVASTICLGQSIQDQSVWSTPSVGTQPGSVDAAEPATDAGQEPLEGPDRNREMRAPVPRTPGLPAAMPKGSADKEPATARIVGPLKTKSEFERYAEDATGRRLPVYGRQMFDEVPTTFAPLENVPVPADYVLGPGDELLIRAWGKVELDSRLTVDRTGQINLPRVGTLTVADLRFGQLAGFLRAAIGGIFKDFELNVALGQLRSIQVFVLGDARQPGAYTVAR